MKGHSKSSRKVCDLIETLTNSSNITSAIQWLADRDPSQTGDTFAPIIPTLKARFDLTDADAAEAILLAGNFLICRRAFG